MSASDSGFTGWSRQRKTRGSVKFADSAARVLISVGGIGTIVAVLMVSLFLAWVVLPLFGGATLDEPRRLNPDLGGEAPVYIAEDEYRVLGWALGPDATARVFRLDDGAVRSAEGLFPDKRLTCSSFMLGQPLMAFGFADGSVQLARIGFQTRFLVNDPGDADRNEVSGELRQTLELNPGVPANFGQGVVELTPQGDYRSQQLSVEMLKSEQVSDKPVVLLDHVVSGDDPFIVMVTGDERGYRLQAIRGTEEENFFTGELELTFGQPTPLPYEPMSPEAPIALAVSGPGNDIYVAWRDGQFIRIRLPGAGAEAFVAERGRLIPEGRTLTSFGFIVGNTTLIWADSEGGVYGGFATRTEALEELGLTGSMVQGTRDPKATFALCQVKQLVRRGPAMTCFAPSDRSRLVVCGFADGTVRLFNMTNEGEVGRVDVGNGKPVRLTTVSPKEDGFLAVSDDGLTDFHLEAGYHEINLNALFGRVWYEGYPGPSFTYQSSAGHTGAEPKYSLIPLIFGTLKATFYSMLFGAPLAILAAIYSSEFLKPRIKAAIKPSIELMASLPSVVLGFLAGLVFAPFIEDVVPATLALFVTLPLCLLGGAYVWQLLPHRATLRMGGWRLAFMILPIVFGVLVAFGIGPVMERALFGGDLKGWLAWSPDAPGAEATREKFATVIGGWTILLLPLTGLIVAWAVNALVNPMLRVLSSRLERNAMAWVDLAKFGGAVLTALLLAMFLGLIGSLVGADPRATFGFWGVNFSPIDTYIQRNSLIVGVIMGFAIIPIIYTIADDALSSVPEHLRSGSLGAGATPWQTAMRIVIPTAMSGIFSALMIGLGRAVGETMIVLMATGNTPILDLNMFAGFRTLSANIAVELPEAPKDGTHYRTLFLAALVLFTMTFVVNTVAEAVRLRFRKRAFQL